MDQLEPIFFLIGLVCPLLYSALTFVYSHKTGYPSIFSTHNCSLFFVSSMWSNGQTVSHPWNLIRLVFNSLQQTWMTCSRISSRVKSRWLATTISVKSLVKVNYCTNTIDQGREGKDGRVLMLLALYPACNKKKINWQNNKKPCIWGMEHKAWVRRSATPLSLCGVN